MSSQSVHSLFGEPEAGEETPTAFQMKAGPILSYENQPPPRSTFSATNNEYVCEAEEDVEPHDSSIQELFSTPEMSSQSVHSLFGEPEAGEETPLTIVLLLMVNYASPDLILRTKPPSSSSASAQDKEMAETDQGRYVPGGAATVRGRKH
ncbi:hypothetical protein UY3_16383 [Chelonia mydas]|uniref:Uncharacterized protein n=1 Tax=Chelonia mydas TaxID=8469 RepID=M7B346_CHEMY|nr:hypothetical protein UY3_16383 [Chelonia mydas]